MVYLPQIECYSNPVLNIMKGRSERIWEIDYVPTKPHNVLECKQDQHPTGQT